MQARSPRSTSSEDEAGAASQGRGASASNIRRRLGGEHERACDSRGHALETAVLSHLDAIACHRSPPRANPFPCHKGIRWIGRSEEHTSELQSIMRISYAVFCLKK